MVCSVKVGDQIRQIHIRFRNVDNWESSINAIDQNYN